MDKDKVPASISWDQYEQNRARFAANSGEGKSRAAPGRAPTSLNGIIRCSRPMTARNVRAPAHPRCWS
ncbi:hypothetical protein [Fimbriiglobus ruber]|uniref:hypothetical protein n=1 Tax=Fimbriiglobus ruber TaxID=1908690 RepID=UPI000B4BA64E|nr:hypothetical protein [Fimbriiglobus ruber]